MKINEKKFKALGLLLILLAIILIGLPIFLRMEFFKNIVIWIKEPLGKYASNYFTFLGTIISISVSVYMVIYKQKIDIKNEIERIERKKEDEEERAKKARDNFKKALIDFKVEIEEELKKINGNGNYVFDNLNNKEYIKKMQNMYDKYFLIPEYMQFENLEINKLMQSIKSDYELYINTIMKYYNHSNNLERIKFLKNIVDGIDKIIIIVEGEL